jgi:large subunit ribosomal protein L18
MIYNLADYNYCSQISASSTMSTNSSRDFIDIIKAGTSDASGSTQGNNASTLDIINTIESSIGVYLYPCLIEYSLISLTVFFIMWRNVGKTEKRSFLRFSDRHVFTVNCSRSSRGLLVGGIIFLLTILTLIPTYLLDEDAIPVTHITELVLLSVSLATVCISYCFTTKLYYDRDAHVDAFDQVLIIITTIGDFAYSFFGVFASIFVENYQSRIPIGIEISIGFLAILQTFLQTNFILDTLKRRTITKTEVRKKPGREAITALLLMNLG